MFKKGRRKEWFSIIKPWAERTIKLTRNGKVQYFDNDKIRDEVNIIGAHVVERTPEEAEGRFFAFEIVSADEKEASLLLSAKTRIEMNSWVKCILLVAKNSWEKAKESESTSCARAMPFPVRSRAADLTDRSSIWSTSNQPNIGSHSIIGLTEDEMQGTVRRCEKQGVLWKSTLTNQERAVLTSLRQQIDLNEQILAETAAEAKTESDQHKPLRHKESEASLWVNRLGQKAASREHTIVPYIGFNCSPADDERDIIDRASDLAPGEQQASISPERSSLLREGITEVNPVMSPHIRRGSLAGVKASLALNRVAMNDTVKNRDEENVQCELWVVSCSAEKATAASTAITWAPATRPRIFKAIEEGNVAYIVQLCAGGNTNVAAVNERLKERNYGMSILHAVMSYGRSDILRLLINLPDSTRPRLRSVVADSVALQQSNDYTSVGWIVGETILHAACTRFVNQDTEEGKRRTQGQIDCLKIAIDHMAAEATEKGTDASNTDGPTVTSDINIQTTHSRWSPLHKAAWFGLAGHVKVLLSYRKPEAETSQAKESTAEEEEEEEEEEMHEEGDDKFLNVDQRDSSGFTALHLAAAAGHLECVRALLGGGANLTLPGGPAFFELDSPTKPSSAFTVMHLAAYGGHSHVLDYLFSLNPTELRYTPRLAHAKATLQALFCRRHSMRGCEGGVDYFAVLSGSIDTLQVCLNHGMLSCLGAANAPEALCASDGSSPLHIAAYQGREEVVVFLLRHEANVAKVSNIHRTPLHEACRGGSVAVIDLLMAAGANCSDTERDFWGNTVVHLAAGANRLAAVKCLVERYAVSIAHRNTEGLLPLDIAVAREHSEVARYLRNHVPAGNDDGDIIPMQDHARRNSYHVVHPQSMSIAENGNAAAAAVAASKNVSPAPAANAATGSPHTTSTKNTARAAAHASTVPPSTPAAGKLVQNKVTDSAAVPPANEAGAPAPAPPSVAASLFGSMPLDDSAGEKGIQR